jgi:hypothetical protein
VHRPLEHGRKAVLESEAALADDEIVPEDIEQAFSFAQVRENICDPMHWIDKDGLVEVLKANPSLRGMVYGYVAEVAFAGHLEKMGIAQKDHFKPDDHKRKQAKSDRTLKYKEKQYTVQLKSIQTNSLKEVSPGKFTATVQNDASDRRRLTLPDGTKVDVTNYVKGEYDVLAVSLQPFTGEWRFAYKKNRDLKQSTHKKYPENVRQFLLATSENISWPLSPDWTEDFFAVIGDPGLGHALNEDVHALPEGVKLEKVEPVKKKAVKKKK